MNLNYTEEDNKFREKVKEFIQQFVTSFKKKH